MITIQKIAVYSIFLFFGLFECVNAQVIVDKYTYQFANGNYTFSVKTLPDDAKTVSVTTTFSPLRKGKLGSITEESIAVKKLLDELKNRQIKISYFYIPTTFQAQVIERVQAAAIRSDVWKDRVPASSGYALAKIISSSKAYDELRAALSAHSMEIASISVENIFITTIPSVEVKVPQTWTTFITIKKVSLAIMKNKKSP